MREDIRKDIYQAVISYARQHHEKDIEAAYEYFWDEEQPEDYLGSAALSLGFINFEDFLVCDYRDSDGLYIIEHYLDNNPVDEKTRSDLLSLKDSIICLYEIIADGEVKTLANHSTGQEITSADSALKELKTGDLFAARFVLIDGEYVMSRSVYPFNRQVKEKVFEFLDHQFSRYRKKKNPGATMEVFLKDEPYAFNLIWINLLFRKQPPQ